MSPLFNNGCIDRIYFVMQQFRHYHYGIVIFFIHEATFKKITNKSVTTIIPKEVKPYYVETWG